MEFTSLQISKLVLGYLKAEKCEKAYDAFLDGSAHLKHCSSTIKSNKRFVTRVAGYSLLEYLTEYAVVYTIIQERLENSDYFNEKRSKNLVDELLYLLDNGKSTRPNTPARSRSSTPFKETSKEQDRPGFLPNLSIIQESTSLLETDTTPLQNLPGNSSDDIPSKIPIQIPPLLSSPAPVTNPDDSDSVDSPDKSVEDDLSQVLTQTLLESHELHERIAENINLVRNTAENTAGASTVAEEGINSGMLQELDTAIKTIVQRTEADPIFEKLIGELIGSASETTDEEQADNQKHVDDSDVSNKNVHLSTALRTPEVETKSIQQRLRSSKKQSPESATVVESLNIDVQSALYPKYLVDGNGQKHMSLSKSDANSNCVENVPLTGGIEKNDNQNLIINTNTGENIIIYDGTFDNFMKTSGPNVVNPSSSLLFNNGLLMVQPTVSAPPVVSTLQVDTSKPCFVWNGSQVVNVSVPQCRVNNLTEQDILNMPTVIVCDDNQQVGSAQNMLVHSYTQQQQKQPRKVINIAPKPEKTADKADNLSEFLTLYRCNDANDKSMSPNDAKSQAKLRTRKKNSKQKATKPQPVQKQVLKLAEEEDVSSETSEVSNVAAEKKEETESDSHIHVQQNDADAPMCATPVLKKQNGGSRNLSTPKSGSHVRVLDFNFGALGKSGMSMKKGDASPSKISKSLFSTPAKNQKEPLEEVDDVGQKPEENSCTSQGNLQLQENEGNLRRFKKGVSSSWDSDLRALAVPASNRCPTPKRKRRDTVCAKKVVKKTKTEHDIQTVAASSPAKNKDILNKLKTSQVTTKRRRRIGAKDVITPAKIVRRAKEAAPKSNEQPDDAEPKDEVVQQSATVDVIDVSADRDAEGEYSSLSDVRFTLINCNMKARYKKKCNIDSNIKKEVKITKVREVKSLECFSDGSNKLILSPSKLNANKRTLVDELNLNEDPVGQSNGKQSVADERDEVAISLATEPNSESKHHEDQVCCGSVNEERLSEDKESEVIEANSSKFVTPEPSMQPASQYPIAAKRNITPGLETPMKMDVSQCPKTPGYFSPIRNNDTPFTKVFKEQLDGVDISSIQTPKFPLTPNFPLTPAGDGKSPYPRRPTDYSTSSSYYQPSDTEHNKSLEQLIIEECKRLETKKPSPVKDQVLPPVPSENKSPPKLLLEETGTGVTAEQDLTNKAIVEKMKSMGNNVIARKNLSLVKSTAVRDDDSSSCDSSSFENTSSTSSESYSKSDDDSSNSVSDETVIHNEDNETGRSTRYNLRSRKTETPNSQKTTRNGLALQTTTEAVQQIITDVEIKPTLENEKQPATQVLSRQEKVLREMEEKRQRIIAKLKNEKVGKDTPQSKASRQSSVSKKVEGQNGKDKTKKGSNRRKTSPPKKVTTVTTSKKSEVKVFNEGEGVTLHLSSDSEYVNIEPFDIVETELLDSSASSAILPVDAIPESHPLKTFHKVLESIKSSQAEKNRENNSDQEAEYLVNGLKEWGIHLVHNKTPRKQDRSAEKQLNLPVTNKVMVLKVYGEIPNENNLDCKSTNRVGNIAEKETEWVCKNKTEVHVTRDEKVESSAESDRSLRIFAAVGEAKVLIDKDEGKISKNGAGTCIDAMKANNLVNDTLEEGEIVSNDEGEAEKVEEEKENRRSQRKGTEKIYKPSSHQHQSSTNFDMKKETRDQTKKLEKQSSQPESISKILAGDENLNFTDLGDITFDVKVIAVEQVHLVWDDNKKLKTTRRDFSADLLNKKITAKVYIESLDEEIDKTMTVTPLEFVLDIPEGFAYKAALDKVKILECVTIPFDKELNVVLNSSPLDNLYEPQPSCSYGSGQKKELPPSRRRNTVDQRDKSRKRASPATKRKRSKSIDQKTLLVEKVKCEEERKRYVPVRSDGDRKSPRQKGGSKFAEKTCENKRTECKVTLVDMLKTKQVKPSSPQNLHRGVTNAGSVKSASSVRKSVKQPVSSRSGGETVKSGGDTSKSEVKSRGETSKSEVKPKKVEDKRDVDTVDREESPVQSFNDDDLMNYAICGSERVENSEEAEVSASMQSTSRRKAGDLNLSDKKSKDDSCQELLRKIDVDIFLKQLHGE